MYLLPNFLSPTPCGFLTGHPLSLTLGPEKSWPGGERSALGSLAAAWQPHLSPLTAASLCSSAEAAALPYMGLLPSELGTHMQGWLQVAGTMPLHPPGPRVPGLSQWSLLGHMASRALQLAPRDRPALAVQGLRQERRSKAVRPEGRKSGREVAIYSWLCFCSFSSNASL